MQNGDLKLPSLDILFKILLSWDFYLDIHDDTFSDISNELEIIQKGLLNVDIKDFHFELDTKLSAHDGSCTESAEDVGGKEAHIKIEPLPLNFHTDAEYKFRFFPLFLLEAKQTIHRAKEMEFSQPEMVVQIHVEERSGFLILTLQRLNVSNMLIQRNDLCLLFINNDRKGFDTSKPSLEANTFLDHETVVLENPKEMHSVHILGVVEHSLNHEICLKVFFPKVSADSSVSIERYQKLAQFINVSGHKWCFCRVMGLSTLIREYQALMSFDELLLKDDLLFNQKDSVTVLSRSLQDVRIKKENMMKHPTLQQKSSFKKLLALERMYMQRLEYHSVLNERKKRERLEIPKELQKKLKGSYNSSQLEAIHECHKVSGVTLIQGPPGTGKTTTIVGILSVILNSSVGTIKDNDLSNPSEEKPMSVSELNAQTLKVKTKENLALNRETSNKTTLGLKKDALPGYHQLLTLAQPWVYQSNYIPWHDTASLVSEDLENFIERTAYETDSVVELAQCYHETQPRRILVCAPSNAAIDEILKRLMAEPSQGGGIFNSEGERYTPAVIRLGPNVHPDLIPFSLEARTNSRLQALGRSALTKRSAVKKSLLSECSIVCSTLSISGSRELTSLGIPFDTVVIDEASQGVELATLIPLKFSCRRLILVGDPRQLPATVFSKLAIENHYDQSLFQRLERAGHKVNVLTIQYRMHPSISAFPSQTFYGGQLSDAPGIQQMIKPPIPWYSIPIFSPMVFFSLNSEEQSSTNASWFNTEEAMIVMELLELLCLLFQRLPGYESCWHEKIAVISPYSEQIRVVRKLLKSRFQTSDGKTIPIDVQTVDGFQGREKDFVIFTAVRANYISSEGNNEKDLKANVGFLADLRRMNVALTRARCNIWIIGNGHYLNKNPEWAKLWRYTEINNFQFHINYKNFPPKGHLRRWLQDYLQRNASARILLETHAPTLIDALQRDIYQIETSSQLQEDELLKAFTSDPQFYTSKNHIIDDAALDTPFT